MRLNRLRELREQQNIDQKVLAADMGVSQPTISDWETGRKQPSRKNAIKLAKYFGKSVDYILGVDIQAKQPVIVNVEGSDQFNEATPEQREKLKEFLKFLQEQDKLKK